MSRLFLITLLLLSSGPVYAEWVFNGKTDDGMTVYVDPDTIRRKGDLVKMWYLFDRKTIQTVAGRYSYLSIKAQNEYDCTAERERSLASTWRLGNMGSGKVVWSDSDESKWRPVEPGTITQELWKVACIKWVLVSDADEAGMTVYVDPDTIRRKGNLVKMWQLYDYKTVQTVGSSSFLSSKVQAEYDCTEKRNRTLAFTWFSGNMGIGKGVGKVVVNDSAPDPWKPVQPGSVGEDLWKVACNKK